MKSSKIKLIVFCGVDGSGKTTMVNYLEKCNILDNAFYFRRKKYEDGNLNAIKSFHRRLYDDARDWRSGDFAKAVGLGIALDFLRFYDSVITGLSQSVEYIVCDRYTYCYLAYLRLLNLDGLIRPLFDGLHQPDLVFYMNVNIHSLSERYKARESSEDDEDIELMKLFDKAYKNILHETDLLSVVNIDNSGNFQFAMNQVVKKLADIGYASKNEKDNLNED